MTHKIQFIDYIKGIGIIFVILGHIGFGSKYIYTFHMPLFFFLSGFLMHTINNKSINSFIISKIKSILLPYFSFSLLSFLWWAIIETNLRPQSTSISKALLNIFYPYVGAEFILIM